MLNFWWTEVTFPMMQSIFMPVYHKTADHTVSCSGRQKMSSPNSCSAEMGYQGRRKTRFSHQGPRNNRYTIFQRAGYIQDWENKCTSGIILLVVFLPRLVDRQVKGWEGQMAHTFVFHIIDGNALTRASSRFLLDASCKMEQRLSFTIHKQIFSVLINVALITFKGFSDMTHL